jgi:nuclear cap-binding protein subunit 2
MMMATAEIQGAIAGEPVDQSGSSNNEAVAATGNNLHSDGQFSNIIIPDEPPRAAILQHTAVDAKLYWDRTHYASPVEQMKALQESSTVYVGNLSFTIKSHHVHHHFTTLLSSSSSNGTSSCSVVKRVILGVDRNQHKPCGFCFVELFHRADALRAVSMISGTQLDGKVIRVELDSGFLPGRQLGRGKSGGQVRDDKRIESMKRYRNDGGDEHRSTTSSQPQSERPVRLDEALPSTRNHGDHLPMNSASNNDNNNATEDMDDDEPSAKRIKRE